MPEVSLNGGKNVRYGNAHKTSYSSGIVLKQFALFINMLSLQTLKMFVLSYKHFKGYSH